MCLIDLSMFISVQVYVYGTKSLQQLPQQALYCKDSTVFRQRTVHDTGKKKQIFSRKQLLSEPHWAIWCDWLEGSDFYQQQEQEQQNVWFSLSRKPLFLSIEELCQHEGIIIVQNEFMTLRV